MNEIGTICCEQIRALTQNKAYNQEPKFVEQKLRRAELMYSNAIKMNPDEILYFINSANVLVDLKEWQQLEKTLKVLENSNRFNKFVTVLEYKNFFLRLSDLKNVYLKKQKYLDYISKKTIKRI